MNPTRLGFCDTDATRTTNLTTKKVETVINKVVITLYKETIEEEVEKYAGVANGTKVVVSPSEIADLYTQLVPTYDDMINTVATHETKHGSSKSANSVFVTKEKAESAAVKSESNSIQQLIKEKANGIQ